MHILRYRTVPQCTAIFFSGYALEDPEHECARTHRLHHVGATGIEPTTFTEETGDFSGYFVRGVLS